jgi:rhodanese-related sulfurtransferase
LQQETTIFILHKHDFTMRKEVQEFSPREAYAAYVRGSVLVDVREPQEAGTSIDVKQVINLPFSELDKRFNELPANRTVVLVSRVGNTSKEAARFLARHGYEQVATVEGGVTAWESEGLPVRGH